MTTDLLIQLSQALRSLPYDAKIETFTGGPEKSYLVELHTKDGKFWGAGESAVSLVNAYTKAERDLRMKRNEAEQNTIHDMLAEQDYQNTINDFLMGTGQR